MNDAEEAFANELMADQTPPATNEDKFAARSSLFHRPFDHISFPVPDQGNSRFQASFTVLTKPVFDLEGRVMEMPLQPWRGPVRGRLDRQATDVRSKLEDPKVVMLVMRGQTYAARSVLAVFWLFLMTKLFGPPKPKKVKAPQPPKKLTPATR